MYGLIYMYTRKCVHVCIYMMMIYMYYMIYIYVCIYMYIYLVYSRPVSGDQRRSNICITYVHVYICLCTHTNTIRTTHTFVCTDTHAYVQTHTEQDIDFYLTELNTYQHNTYKSHICMFRHMCMYRHTPNKCQKSLEIDLLRNKGDLQTHMCMYRQPSLMGKYTIATIHL